MPILYGSNSAVWSNQGDLLGQQSLDIRLLLALQATLWTVSALYTRPLLAQLGMLHAACSMQRRRLLKLSYTSQLLSDCKHILKCSPLRALALHSGTHLRKVLLDLVQFACLCGCCVQR